MSEKDIYLVFIIWRDVGKINYGKWKDKNIIIVERENLERIYTPTLASRSHFYSEICKEIKGLVEANEEKEEANEEEEEVNEEDQED